MPTFIALTLGHGIHPDDGVTLHGAVLSPVAHSVGAEVNHFAPPGNEHRGTGKLFSLDELAGYYLIDLLEGFGRHAHLGGEGGGKAFFSCP